MSEVDKKEEKASHDMPKKQLNQLTDLEFIKTIYHQTDVVNNLKKTIAQEERKLSILDAEGRRRAAQQL